MQISTSKSIGAKARRKREGSPMAIDPDKPIAQDGTVDPTTLDVAARPIVIKKIELDWELEQYIVANGYEGKRSKPNAERAVTAPSSTPGRSVMMRFGVICRDVGAIERRLKCNNCGKRNVRMSPFSVIRRPNGGPQKLPLGGWLNEGRLAVILQRKLPFRTRQHSCRSHPVIKFPAAAVYPAI